MEGWSMQAATIANPNFMMGMKGPQINDHHHRVNDGSPQPIDRPNIKDYWSNCLNQLDYAFQPIVNIHTGRCYGYEALLRHVETVGFETIGSFFDLAYMDDVLHFVDRQLRKKAIEKISPVLEENGAKLFFNLDSRLLTSTDYQTGFTRELCRSIGVSEDCFCMEVSERHRWADPIATMNILNNYRNQGFKIAVDDFGNGFSGLQMIYYLEPDYLKIDRFFIKDLGNDHKKRMFVSQIVNIAHTLGSIVIAEGVETESEYYACLGIGCDLIQGFLVQRPQLEVSELKRDYAHIYSLAQRNLRKSNSHDYELIHTQMENIEPIHYQLAIQDVFDRFRMNPECSFFPVVNESNHPIGIIREKSIKSFAYSKFGRDLLLNPRYGKSVLHFVSRFPVADIHSSIEKILEIYTQNQGIEGILIVDSMQYRGFLSASALLRILNEKNITLAREQNPLSGLPGNTLIHQYISQALFDTENHYLFVWFDFDHFKPYNDLYGFRNGDRLILRFAEMLKGFNHNGKRFVGHIGGDDFFMGFRNENRDQAMEIIRGLLVDFRKDAESFYDTKTISMGFVVAKGRDGTLRQYPLVSVSAVVVELPTNRSNAVCCEDLSCLMGELKSQAKRSMDKLCIHRLNGAESDQAVAPGGPF